MTKALSPLLTLLLASGLAQAQIRTDASLGQAARSLSGPNFAIPQTLGKLSGNNLFHSFQTFNLASGEAANFSTTSPGIANVISRVTGGDASQINGTLRLAAASGAPAFFFINPAGITFGAGASVDVPGAFHVSTANSVKFADGRFNADLGQGSTFSSAAPEAFGFLGSTRGTIWIKDGAVLQPQKAFPVSVVAGDIKLDGGGFGVRAGEVRAIAVGTTAADIAMTGQVPAVTGNLAVINNGFITSANLGAVPAGLITVRAGNILVDASGVIKTIGTAAESGGTGRVDVQATQDLLLSDGGNITSANMGDGPAGDIQIQANRITLLTEGYVYSNALASSATPGANIIIRATDAVTINNASVSSDARSSGNAGDILIQARSIAISARGYVASNTYIGSTGGTGIINLNASDSIALSDRGRVYASTSSSGPAGTVRLSGGDIALRSLASVDSVALEGTANAGNVELVAQRSLALDNASLFSIASASGHAGSVRAVAQDISIDNTSIISSTAARGSGNAGTVQVLASASLSLRGRSLIDSSTDSSGQAGSVKVAGADIYLDGSGISSNARDGTGNAGRVEVASTSTLVLANDASIVSNTHTAGDAGLVQITGRDVSLRSGGHVGTSTLGDVASPGVGGHAGGINVVATGTLSISDGFLSSSTFTSGRAGTIDVQAGVLRLQGARSSISAVATAESAGQTGNITLRASGLISLADQAFISNSNFARPASLGGLSAATLSLSSPNIHVLGDAFVSAGSFGTVGAGSIDVRFTEQLVMSSGAISTRASLGDGGNITIQGGKLVAANKSQITTSVLGANGNGGDIRISADALALSSGFIQANTFASQASGGLISLNLQTLVANGNTLFVGGQTPYRYAPDVFGFNVIQAAAPTGISGAIQITSPVLDVSGTLGRLGAPPIDTVSLGRSPCQTTGGSSLALMGQGALPVSYRGLLGAVPIQPPVPAPRPSTAAVNPSSTTAGSPGSARPDAAITQLALLAPACQ